MSKTIGMRSSFGPYVVSSHLTDTNVCKWKVKEVRIEDLFDYCILLYSCVDCNEKQRKGKQGISTVSSSDQQQMHRLNDTTIA